MRSFFKEFKEFAVKGNVIDLAVGVVIGSAFNKIVSSLVKDIIMPPFGLLWGNSALSNYKWVLKDAVNVNGTIISEEVAITYGQFFGSCLDFMIIAFSIFLVIKFINSLKRKAEDETEVSVPTPKDIQLLSEIRDLLKDGDRKA